MNTKELTIDKVQKMYLDRINNFLTNEKFAEYYGLHIAEANAIIEKGAVLQETFSNLHQQLACLRNLK